MRVPHIAFSQLQGGQVSLAIILDYDEDSLRGQMRGRGKGSAVIDRRVVEFKDKTLPAAKYYDEQKLLHLVSFKFIFFQIRFVNWTRILKIKKPLALSSFLPNLVFKQLSGTYSLNFRLLVKTLESTGVLLNEPWTTKPAKRLRYAARLNDKTKIRTASFPWTYLLSW